MFGLSIITLNMLDGKTIINVVLTSMSKEIIYFKINVTSCVDEWKIYQKYNMFAKYWTTNIIEDYR